MIHYIFIAVFSFSLFADVLSDFENETKQHINEDIKWLKENAVKTKPCYTNGASACVWEFVKNTAVARSGDELLYLLNIIEKTTNADLETLDRKLPCTGDCFVVRRLRKPLLIYELLKKIPNNERLVRKFAKARADKKDGLLFIQYADEIAIYFKAEDKVKESIIILMALERTKDISEKQKKDVNELLVGFQKYDLKQLLKGGIILDETISDKSVKEDYLAHIAKKDTPEEREKTVKGILGASILFRNSSSNMLKYLDPVKGQQKYSETLATYLQDGSLDSTRLILWKRSNTEGEGKCPAETTQLECFIKYVKEFPYRTSAGATAASDILVTMIIKDWKQPKCDENCKDRLSFVFQDYALEYLKGFKLRDLPVVEWKNKNQTHPGVLVAHATEEIMYTKHLLNQTKHMQWIFKIRLKKSTSPEYKSKAEKALTDLKLITYDHVFFGSLLADKNITKKIILDDSNKLEIGNPLKANDGLFKDIQEIRTAFKL